MSESVEEKKRIKRQNILYAAIQSFSENGFAETTIAEIAKGAGVSFGTVFTYFESKEALYQSAILEPLEEIKPYFFEIEDRFKGNPLEMVIEMIECHVKIFAMKSDFLRLVQQVLGRPDRFPKAFKDLNDFVDTFVENVRPVIEKGQVLGQFYQESPSLIAQSYLSILNGMRLTFTDESTHSLWNALTIQALRLFAPITNK